MKGLHALNTLRVPFIREGLISTGSVAQKNINTTKVLDGVKCLEVGCGAGILTEALARMKAQTVGLDLSKELIEAAKAHASDDLKIDYVCASIEDYSNEFKNHFDALVVSEVLEHIDDKKSFLKAAIETLKPGGSIFITTFNKTLPSLFGGVIAAEYILNLVPRNTHDWEMFISPSSLEKILADNDCQTLVVQGIEYHFWNNTMHWQNKVDISYALHAVKHQ